MTDHFLLHFEHARNLFDEADQIALPEPEQAQNLALTGIGRVLLAIAGELRRQNDRGDAFTVELLSFFERLTEDPQPGPEGDGSLRSGQPAAAPDGQEGGASK